MRSTRLVAILLAAAAPSLGAAQAARAVPLPFVATLAFKVGALATFSASGSGIGSSDGAGGTASLPAGAFSLRSTQALVPPLLGAVFGIAIAGPGQNGMGTPLPLAGANRAFTFDGAEGRIRLDASVYLLNKGSGRPPVPKAITGIPLHLIGTDATSTAVIIFPLGRETIFGQRFRLGMRTAAGGLNDAASTASGTGFDLRTVNGLGRLQLVSPNSVSFGALGTLPILATLSIEFVPEPATALSLGAGLVALGAWRSARSAPRARP